MEETNQRHVISVARIQKHWTIDKSFPRGGYRIASAALRVGAQHDTSCAPRARRFPPPSGVKYLASGEGLCPRAPSQIRHLGHADRADRIGHAPTLRCENIN